MLSKDEKYKLGISAIQEGRYSESIEFLEQFCQSCQLDSKSEQQYYLKAQMGLVKAYHRTKQYQKASLICQELISSKNIEVKNWAERFLNSLHQKKLVQEITEKEAIQLLKSGKKAVKNKSYSEAVEILEKYCQGVNIQGKDYPKAQMLLVKAYRGSKELEKARNLCQELTLSEHEVTQIWAKRFIINLISQEDISSSTSTIKEKITQPSSKNIKKEFKVRSLEEFKDFCQQILFTELQEVENTRKETIKSISFVIILVFITLILLITIFPWHLIVKYFTSNLLPPWITIFIFLFAVTICFSILINFYNSSTETYAKDVKSRIISKIFDFINIDGNLKYFTSPSWKETEQVKIEFLNSQIFKNFLHPNKIYQSECISGKLGNTRLFLSEICAQSETSHPYLAYLNKKQKILSFNSFLSQSIIVLTVPIYALIWLTKFIKVLPYILIIISQGKRLNLYKYRKEILDNSLTQKTIFQGIFLSAYFPKIITGNTIIASKSVPLDINIINIIPPENIDFNKYFIVYSDNQVEAKYILSINIMKKLVNFVKTTRKDIYISFIDNIMYIAIEHPQDLLEPLLFQNMLSFAPLRTYFIMIQLILIIVKDLNLNLNLNSDTNL
ncbi:MAG: DUF3137 domain-containing protein [Mastigocoleus sp.]